RMAAATVASRVLTVTMTGLRTVMGLMGGPVGVVTLAAAAWFMWSQNSKQAVQDAQNLASSQEDLKNKLKDATLEQQRALSVQLQRAAITLDEQIAAENRELAELKNRLSTVTRYQAEATEGTSEYNRLAKDRKELEGDVAIKIGEISTLEQKAQQVKSNLTTVLNNLTAAVMGHTDALKAENEQLSIN
ncbi:phage tail tape measure protein, partial [Luteibacter rhizovicinus]|uniref:phage tail tape measure protein n=1 Tax=Luteibacter rhizovicinus TaxID=242606 RepID=UPI001B80AFB8